MPTRDMIEEALERYFNNLDDAREDLESRLEEVNETVEE
jgi:hypothetical protein